MSFGTIRLTLLWGNANPIKREIPNMLPFFYAWVHLFISSLNVTRLVTTRSFKNEKVCGEIFTGKVSQFLATDLRLHFTNELKSPSTPIKPALSLTLIIKKLIAPISPPSRPSDYYCPETCVCCITWVLLLTRKSCSSLHNWSVNM